MASNVSYSINAPQQKVNCLRASTWLQEAIALLRSLRERELIQECFIAIRFQ
jgi:hypothetical protein